MRRLISLLVPLALVVGWLLYLGRAPEEVRSPLTERMERALGEGSPRVVLLGASKLGTDVDRAALAGSLGLGPRDVVSLGQSSSTAPLWYAILENRVYRRERVPALVLVYSTLDWALNTTITPAMSAVLASQIGEDEPVLTAKVFGGRDPRGFRARVDGGRSRIHDAFFGAIRDRSVGLWAGVDDDEASALAEPALEELFGLGAARELSGPARVIPIAEGAREAYGVAAGSLEDTLVPDLLALAQSNGSRVVFIRAPVRRAAEPEFRVSAGLEAALVAHLAANGAGYVDLRDLRLPDGAFGDNTHANAAGRARITRALGERLGQIHALGPEPIAAATSGRTFEAPALRRAGVPPAIPLGSLVRGRTACGWEAPLPGWALYSDPALREAGLGPVSPLILFQAGRPLAAHADRATFADRCAFAFAHHERMIRFSPRSPTDELDEGEWSVGWAEDLPLVVPGAEPIVWVYPGTRLEFSWKEGWSAGEALSWTVQAYAPGERGGGVRVAGVAAPFVADGAILTSRGRFPAPTGPWTLEVEGPEGGGLVLRRVVVGRAGDVRWYLGDGVGEHAESTMGVRAAEVTIVPGPVRPLSATEHRDGEARVFDLTPFRIPRADVVFRTAGVAGCTPVRVVAGGVDLGAPKVRRGDILAADGQFGQVGGELLVRAEGEVTLSLDPTRRCRGMWWLYPGDVARLEYPTGTHAGLLDDLTGLVLSGVGEGEEPLAVRVLAGDEVRLDTSFPVRALAEDRDPFVLSPSVGRAPGPLTVELSLPTDAAPVLLTAVSLQGGGPIFR